jgi:hypothetical protein
MWHYSNSFRKALGADLKNTDKKEPGTPDYAA